MEIIPAIDLLDGRCVRLLRGDFAKVTAYDRDPHELASTYRAAGARRLHVVDLDGARTGVPANSGIIHRLASESGMAVQAGGGVRSLDSAKAMLKAGADRVVIGSIAIEDSRTAIAWLNELGPDQLVLAIDVRCDSSTGEPIAMTHGWRQSSGISLWEIMDLFVAAGASHFLCTDVSRDGTLTGANNGLYATCVRRYPSARVIASGGLASAADIPALAATGVAGVVTGKALLDGRLTVEELRQFWHVG